MAHVTIDHYDLNALEALEHEHPEFGRIEVLDGTLIATGVDVNGYRHQSAAQAVLLALIASCPPDQAVRYETYWFVGDARLRPDIAVWRRTDRPADGGAVRVPPVAVIEVLSRDRDHDLGRKRRFYAEHGVRAWFVDPSQSDGWWLRDADGVDHDGDRTELRLPGWPVVVLDRDGVVQQ